MGSDRQEARVQARDKDLHVFRLQMAAMAEPEGSGVSESKSVPVVEETNSGGGTFEILFEFKNCRRALQVSKENLLIVLEDFIGKNLGEDAKIVLGDFNLGKTAKKFLYVLQKFSPKWEKFVDITDINLVSEGDCLSAALLYKDEEPVSSGSPADLGRGGGGVLN